MRRIDPMRIVLEAERPMHDGNVFITTHNATGMIFPNYAAVPSPLAGPEPGTSRASDRTPSPQTLDGAALDRLYKAGTIEHSMASVVLRRAQTPDAMESLRRGSTDKEELLRLFSGEYEHWRERSQDTVSPVHEVAVHHFRGSRRQLAPATAQDQHDEVFQDLLQWWKTHYGSPLTFDRDEAVMDILETESGLTRHELDALVKIKRAFSPAVSGGGATTQSQTLVEQFDYLVSRQRLGGHMAIECGHPHHGVATHSFSPYERLNAKQEEFNAKLVDWARYRAKLKLCLEGKTLSPDAVTTEMALVTDHHKVETEEQGRAQLADFLVGLIPFVGAGYTMYKGLRRNDSDMIRDGMVSLALDVASVKAHLLGKIAAKAGTTVIGQLGKNYRTPETALADPELQPIVGNSVPSAVASDISAETSHHPATPPARRLPPASETVEQPVAVQFESQAQPKRGEASGALEKSPSADGEAVSPAPNRESIDETLKRYVEHERVRYRDLPPNVAAHFQGMNGERWIAGSVIDEATGGDRIVTILKKIPGDETGYQRPGRPNERFYFDEKTGLFKKAPCLKGGGQCFSRTASRVEPPPLEQRLQELEQSARIVIKNDDSPGPDYLLASRGTHLADSSKSTGCLHDALGWRESIPTGKAFEKKGNLYIPDGPPADDIIRTSKSIIARHPFYKKYFYEKKGTYIYFVPADTRDPFRWAKAMETLWNETNAGLGKAITRDFQGRAGIEVTPIRIKNGLSEYLKAQANLLGVPREATSRRAGTIGTHVAEVSPHVAEVGPSEQGLPTPENGGSQIAEDTGRTDVLDMAPQEVPSQILAQYGSLPLGEGRYHGRGFIQRTWEGEYLYLKEEGPGRFQELNWDNGNPLPGRLYQLVDQPSSSGETFAKWQIERMSVKDAAPLPAPANAVVESRRTAELPATQQAGAPNSASNIGVGERPAAAKLERRPASSVDSPLPARSLSPMKERHSKLFSVDDLPFIDESIADSADDLSQATT